MKVQPTQEAQKELILPYIAKNEKFSTGENICLCFSPERIDPGNQTYNTSNTPKVIGGITEKCSEVGKELYSKIIKRSSCCQFYRDC